jgi:hypothetical protein
MELFGDGVSEVLFETDTSAVFKMCRQPKSIRFRFTNVSDLAIS